MANRNADYPSNVLTRTQIGILGRAIPEWFFADNPRLGLGMKNGEDANVNTVAELMALTVEERAAMYWFPLSKYDGEKLGKAVVKVLQDTTYPLKVRPANDTTYKLISDVLTIKRHRSISLQGNRGIMPFFHAVIDGNEYPNLRKIAEQLLDLNKIQINSGTATTSQGKEFVRFLEDLAAHHEATPDKSRKVTCSSFFKESDDA
jgi:hypothetical protein|tara:strand:+ start:18223 stop:18834 length:612 start_codon:yes stop_codon:yes gene_type:complete